MVLLLMPSGMAGSRSHKGLNREQYILSHVLVLGGFLLIGIGAVLPWVDKQLQVKVYVLGMQSGLERIGVRRLLVVAGVGVLVEIARLFVSDRRTVLEFVLVGVGGVVAVMTVLTSPFTSLWTPALGVYVTLAGSLLVTLGASIALLSTRLTNHPRTH
ncbi:hypothetical protein [Halobaculum magnesiiphilum]|uniref:Uncharacterized protein n=1 Tax=Halobaculum magnesiiphilum TaxID=1017351 RepID=A0A8T8WB17_9EURY|nr:hypothetical protein [Halobaculum magnesiiphilum]QZP37049.1 hypothetical protein K6T50_12215 [Halobaculum magnesiiphilum]